MTSSQAINNEDFLGDCTTNVFSLADTSGLKWKKYASACLNSDSTENDPILSAYSIARAADVLCVWKRVTQPGLTLDDSSPLFDCPKELIIFWYGDEPSLSEFPGPSLQEIEFGTADDGITSENLDSFFKAIHNVIEKNLLSDNFVRLGNWFTRPQSSEVTISNQNASALAFSFSIFIHGKSSVVASVNIKQKGVIRLLSKKDLQKASHQHGSFNSKEVLLAPFGLNGQLTGNSIPDTDSRSAKIMSEWARFFPLDATKADNTSVKAKSDSLPLLVEIILGESKMFYPSTLVLIQSQSTGNLLKGKDKELQVNPTKIVDQVWKKLKKKDEPSSPSKQLWEFKDHTIPAGCKCCSNSNVSRVKSNVGSNPFNTSYLYATNQNNVSQNKTKKEPTQTAQTNFHQRPIKVEKTQGRITPSLTGRVTPSMSGSYKQPPSQSSLERPASVTSTKALGSVESQLTPTVKVESQSLSTTTNSLPTLSTNTTQKTRNFQVKQKNKYESKLMYSIPRSTHLSRPMLKTGTLEIRTSVSQSDEFKIKTEEELMSPNSVFGDDIASNSQLGQLSVDISCSDGSNKSIKQEKPAVPVKRGPGRPKGRRNSTLSPSGTVNEEELLSPNTRRQSARQMLRGSRKRDSPTQSPKPDSPPSGPGRPKKSRRSTRAGEKTPNTPKSEPVFTFGNSSVKSVSSVSSPTTPFLPPPSVKPSSNSLTSQKDIEVSEADLMHLFDDEEDDDHTAKMPHPTSQHNATSVLSPFNASDDQHHITSSTPMITTTTLTSHDLAKMFPTPPSLEEPITHQTMSPTNVVESHIMTAAHSTILLSPAESSRGGSMEDIHNLRSPGVDIYPTFQLPIFETMPMPEDFKPVRLPSEKLPRLKGKYQKYIPSWEQNPPLLSRRPSNNRTTQASNNVEITLRKSSSTVFDSKLSLPLISPALSQRTFSDTTPSLSGMPIDHQSLLLNLRLADSFMNWINKNVAGTDNSNAFSIQDKTFKIFNIYQDLLWKNTSFATDHHPLFPEDEPMEGTLDMVKKQVADLQPSKFPFSTDLIEILLKQFSSSFSIKYFYKLLSQYYVNNDAQQTDSGNLKRNALCDEKQGLQQRKLLHDLKPVLESAFQKPLNKNSFDQTRIEGPLTFTSLNSNKNVLSSIPPSTNGLLFSYDSDSFSVSPDAVKHWQRLFLEPLGGQRNVEYIVLLPDADVVVNGMKLFFKELNSLYESLNLGSHVPIVKELREGFLRISQKSVSPCASEVVDPWFDQSNSNLMAKMKVVAQFCKRTLGSYLTSVFDRNTNKRSAMSPTTPNSNGNLGFSSISSTSLTVSLEESLVKRERETQPFIVLYMVDPFNVESQLNNYPHLWSYVGLMKSLLEMKNDLNDYLKENLLFEIIPLEQILNLTSKTGQPGGPHNSELKELALSVYSKCRPNALSYISKIDKCMTGFGVCHIRESLVHRRKRENNLPTTVYMPPYILSPSPKYLNHELKNVTKAKEVFALEKGTNILFCCYCLSSDKQWMFVTCTDQLGELNETTMIRIAYPKRKKNKGLIWSVSLNKLWQYLNGVLSFSICSWRIVLTKYGDVGVHELKELKAIIQKNIELLVPEGKAGRPLSPNENCSSCSNDLTKKGNNLFKSISFCTVKRDNRIGFVKTKKVRNTNVVNCRIYVMPSHKLLSNLHKSVPPLNGMGGQSLLSGVNLGGNSQPNDLLGGDPTSLLNTSFDEDNESSFIPMLNSPADNLFQNSPQTELSKILSPQSVNSPHNTVNSMPSLSPFQPIQNKQHFMTTPVKNQLSQDKDVCECLSEGYIVALFSKDTPKDSTSEESELIKADLYVHCVSGEAKPFYAPLDTTEYLEVLRNILERFEILSWLNIDPSSGKRKSAYPIHVSSVIACRDILDKLTDG